MIPVTKPFLPPRTEVNAYLDGIWERNWLTNNGPLVRELEDQLRLRFRLKNLLFVSNGTIAIQVALKALNIRNKVITTPFSYVATTSSIAWEGCTPVFVDIDPDTLNIDPRKIEPAITSDTEAILATHCFGNPCDIRSIYEISQKYGLKVIFDAAHCFGSEYEGKSVYHYGDVCAASFHSTKVFHTIEGGAIITPDDELSRRMALMRNFGHNGPEKFRGVGINAKNSEIHAAFGLCNLRHIDEVLMVRKKQCQIYDRFLKELDARKPTVSAGAKPNYSYYPLIFKSESEALAIKGSLERNEIFPRRYFYPPLNSLDYVPNIVAPIAEDIARRILCLPLYHELTEQEQEKIAQVMLEVQIRD